MPADVEGSGAGKTGFGSEDCEESLGELSEIERDANVKAPITRTLISTHEITPRMM
jgi:hypothetical protein